MAKIKQEVTSELGIEVKKIEGKTYEELVEIARQNNEARRLELVKQEEVDAFNKAQMELVENEE